MAGRLCYGETEAPFVDCGWAPLRSLVVGRWKYIRTPIVELYDTRRDPRETENLAEALPQRVAAMEERLAEMERAMTARAAGRVALSRDERRQLESLGYAAGSASSGAETNGAPDPMTLRDVKTVVRLHATSWEIRNRFVAGDHGDELVARCRDLIDRSPETGRFHELLGSVLLARGEAVDAAHHLRKAAALCPGDVEILTTLGVSLYKAGDFGEASGHLSAAIRLDPLAARARAVQGAVSVAKGDFDAAIPELREAIRLDADEPLAQQYLAEALRAEGLYRECVHHYAEALRLRPRWREAMEGLAWVLATCEIPEVRDAERALPLAWDLCESTKHKDAAALSTLAAAFAARGRMDRALAVASNALTVARSEGKEGLAGRIRECLDSYEAGDPFIDRPRVAKP
jgi:tetratricopeptide (TPR) repeat protein